ncbi:MAG: hypothetical protein DRQ65_01190 [Gammaproteobacteria bacterium]|nr:MAG: hypothetical protein DRQ98_08540 [Gammaproteobacteria bacterium]RLA57605.1 MAG: hypothetical protein DRQ65_01190 [Gammaproteobacteria bacterium]HDY82705.1 hypothetical protein [Halieaceae bacterium]
MRARDDLSYFKLELHKVKSMSDNDQGDSGQVPMMQKLLDNPFLLLFIGVASPAVLYLGWGIMEIVMIPAR